jgi:ribonuclease T2
MKTVITPALLCMLLSLTLFASASKHHRHRHDSASGGAFDYYILSLSWAPNYCASHPTDHSNQCRHGGHTAFVLHGLWPQADSGPPPISCSIAPPVAGATVDHMLNFMPSRGLIQHEWQQHGTCSGLSARDYFANVEQAFKSLHVPDQYQNLNHDQQAEVSDIEKEFADANGAPRQAFRISCHNGELVNLEVCLDKDLHFQSCTPSARECPARKVEMRPPQ